MELTHWVSISLKRALTLMNILVRFMSSGIGPLDLDDTKMDGEMSANDCWPSKRLYEETIDRVVDARVN